MRRQQLTNRIRLLSVVVAVIGLLLISRLYYLQIARADYYSEKAEKQYVHTKSDLYSRGSILFTTKDNEKLSAAAVQAGYLLAVNPEHVVDASEFCEKIRNFVTIERDLCVERASLNNRTYVELEDRLSNEQAEELEKMHVEGALLYRNQWRYYPGGSVAARSVGFVGYTDEDGNELRGKFGLERQYDEVLYRKREVMSVNFFAELFSNVGEFVDKSEQKRSGDVVTTLEPAVSRLLDTVLLQTNDLYKSKMTGAIIMDPNTGAIYAMNVVPSFDLNSREDATIEQFRNPLVEDVYEMGSIIKTLTMAAGLDAGTVNAGTTYYDPGCIDLNTYTICNFDKKGRGTVPMQQVLNQSLNTGVAYIVSKMGKERFRDYFINYGLGEPTGIDLPGEAHGLIENLKSPRDVEYATASFGQGIALTPIETIRALSTLANGGRLVTPHLADRIEYDDGTIEKIQYPESKQVLKESTSEEISRMLTVVVDEALRGGNVALPHYSIGAKTGTAQIADPNGGGYYEDKYLHSFFGYFPAYEPRFIVFMYTVEPQGVEYASETLTDPFMEIARFLINYYSIPPDR
ncbi:MAG: penicillin-binding protein 2 [Candidatus Pacebacteria bacterium]|nr:penicillin-binding protein 2 [Candidatus Paceibacterota bacterium]MBP9843030.1 penicillin-binding protein 2 [Candidatus Paceibacterota bacterium]